MIMPKINKKGIMLIQNIIIYFYAAIPTFAPDYNKIIILK